MKYPQYPTRPIALSSEKVPAPHAVLEHHLHGVSEAVDEDPFEDDHQLEHELRPGLQEALNGAQVRALLRPPTVTSGPDHPATKREIFHQRFGFFLRLTQPNQIVILTNMMTV